MFDHVMLNVSDRAESMKLYTPALQVLGIKVLYDKDEYVSYGTDSFHFWLREAESKDVTRKAHLCFAANTREQVDGFYEAALAAGAKSNGAPGLRDHGPSYYAAYVFDFEGNNIEVVCKQ
jgi:catechol-2,3-dioxygenase